MIPHSKIQPGGQSLLVEPAPKRPRRWGLPTVTTLVTLVVLAAITLCSLMLKSHELHRRAMLKDVAVLGDVRSFMTGFTSLDPFHANKYVERVLAQTTGDFAKQYHDKENEIRVQVASAAPTTGTVLDAGVARWNDDGTANVLLATKVTAKSPDGKSAYEKANRWVATVRREGDRWKISDLLQVI
jgi:Mce-associated membrane protein